jgi:drug/metabolite transporter (DMT)-like permease
LKQLLSPAAVGAACCVVSALGYSLANICLRQLAGSGCDPLWVVCNKEGVSVLIVGPWLLAQAVRGLPTLPRGKTLGMLILVGLATQLGGNAGQQWAFAVAGLTVTIPVIIAVVLIFSGLFGWFLLGEKVSARSTFAIGLLVVAVTLLSLGAKATSPVEAVGALRSGPLLVVVALVVASVAGVIYAMLSIAIRHSVTRETRLSAVVFLITSMGVLSLGPLSLYRLGWQELASTRAEHFLWMAAAGICNLVAFFALSKALQHTTVVHANMVNASQVALSAVAGIALFNEPTNIWLVFGILLTIAGIFLTGRPEEPAVDQSV